VNTFLAGRRTMGNTRTLNDTLIEGIRDLYVAEEQLARALTAAGCRRIWN